MLHLHVIWPKNVIFLSQSFQLSVVNPEHFEEFKAREVLKFWKEQESHQNVF